MKEIWCSINKFLNDYSGLVGAVSLLFSFFIFVKTGQIKKNIKSLLSHKDYEIRKKKAKKELEGMLASICKDDIFDDKLLGEVSREIASLEHYSLFFDKKTKRNIKELKKELEKDAYNRNKNNVIRSINKVIGDIEIKETYLG